MRTETYNGCKIKARAGRKATWGQMFVLLNGESLTTVEKFDEVKAIAEVKKMIDFVHSSPIDGDRWGAYFYASGTYELCSKGLHPQEIGGACTHFTCQTVDK